MTDFTIPCDAFARLAGVIDNLSPDVEPCFRAVRIDNGCLVVTDRRFMAIECIGGNPGIAHIIPDNALVTQCREEAKFNSTLTITVVEALQHTVAKTSFGYVTPGNVGYFPGGLTDFDKWRSVVMMCKEPAKEPVGGMFWETAGIVKLANSSPSGSVIFEQIIDTRRPTLIRDTTDGQWLGVFNPHSMEHSWHSPASLPTWMVA